MEDPKTHGRKWSCSPSVLQCGTTGFRTTPHITLIGHSSHRLDVQNLSELVQRKRKNGTRTLKFFSEVLLFKTVCTGVQGCSGSEVGVWRRVASGRSSSVSISGKSACANTTTDSSFLRTCGQAKKLPGWVFFQPQNSIL